MNSSAKQISPASPAAKPTRKANPSLFGQELLNVLETVPEPAASGPEYAVNGVG
jgi:hypothetical protein